MADRERLRDQEKTDKYSIENKTIIFPVYSVKRKQYKIWRTKKLAKTGLLGKALLHLYNTRILLR